MLVLSKLAFCESAETGETGVVASGGRALGARAPAWHLRGWAPRVVCTGSAASQFRKKVVGGRAPTKWGVGGVLGLWWFGVYV